MARSYPFISVSFPQFHLSSFPYNCTTPTAVDSHAISSLSIIPAVDLLQRWKAYTRITNSMMVLGGSHLAHSNFNHSSPTTVSSMSL
jgi:hypothetical protein